MPGYKFIANFLKKSGLPKQSEVQKQVVTKDKATQTTLPEQHTVVPLPSLHIYHAFNQFQELEKEINLKFTDTLSYLQNQLDFWNTTLSTISKSPPINIDKFNKQTKLLKNLEFEINEFLVKTVRNLLLQKNFHDLKTTYIKTTLLDLNEYQSPTTFAYLLNVAASKVKQYQLTQQEQSDILFHFICYPTIQILSTYLNLHEKLNHTWKEFLDSNPFQMQDPKSVERKLMFDNARGLQDLLIFLHKDINHFITSMQLHYSTLQAYLCENICMNVERKQSSP